MIQARNQDGTIVAQLASGAERRDRKRAFEERIVAEVELAVIPAGAASITVSRIEMRDEAPFIRLGLAVVGQRLSIRAREPSIRALINALERALGGQR